MPHPKRNRFQRKERPEVRIELENEIEHLTSEVSRLKRENKQLQIEKENTEFRCSDIKEKADVLVSKLRNQLAALQKKQEKVTVSTPKDKYVAKKILQKSFGGGAGILNITNMQPSTVPTGVDPTSSVQSLTFSQFMKRNSQEGGEEFNTSLRHYQQQQQQQRESLYDTLHIAAPPSSSSMSEELKMSPYPHTSQFDLLPPSEEQDGQFNGHGVHSDSPSSAPGLYLMNKAMGSTSMGGEEGSVSCGANKQLQPPPAMRSKSIAPPPRSVEDIIQNNNSEFTQFLDSSDVLAEDHHLISIHNKTNAKINCDAFDDEGDLPIVDIDLRSV